MTDNIGSGKQKRRQGNLDTLEDRVTFRDSFRDMMDSINTPYDQCIQFLLDGIKLDPNYGVSIEGSVTNLTDKKYIATVGSNGFTASGDSQTLLPGAPRQWFVSLRKGF